MRAEEEMLVGTRHPSHPGSFSRGVGTGGMSCCALNLSQISSLSPADPPVAAAVVSHFNDCPASHSQFCFHGTCRFLVQEEKPACV